MSEPCAYCGTPDPQHGLSLTVFDETERLRCVDPFTCRNRMLARLAALEAENARLREALLPFARAYRGGRAGPGYASLADYYRAAELVEKTNG